MNSLGITPLEDGVCHICQEAPASKEYVVRGRGYGSSFDGIEIRWRCCPACDRKRYEEWVGETPQSTPWGDTYAHERALFAFLESLPVNSQEQIFNGSDGYKIDAQDWIDLHLGELSAKKKKQYGFDDELFDREYEV